MRATCVSWEHAWVCFWLQSGDDVDTRRMVETTLLVDRVGQCVKGIIGRRRAAQGVLHHLDLAQLKSHQLGHVLKQWSRPCTGHDARSTFGAALSIEHGGQAGLGRYTWPELERPNPPARPTVGRSTHLLGRDPRVESAHCGSRASISSCWRTSPLAAASVQPR